MYPGTMLVCPETKLVYPGTRFLMTRFQWDFEADLDDDLPTVVEEGS